MRKVGFALDKRLMNLHKERDTSRNFSKDFNALILEVGVEEVGTATASVSCGGYTGSIGLYITHEAHERLLKISSRLRKNKSLVLRAILHILHTERGNFQS